MPVRICDVSRPIADDASGVSSARRGTTTSVVTFSRSWQTATVNSKVLRRIDLGFTWPDRSGVFVDENGDRFTLTLFRIHPIQPSAELLADPNVTLRTVWVRGSRTVDPDAAEALAALREAQFQVRKRAETAPVADPCLRRTIRFFPDHGRYAMLWEPDGLTSPRALGLSQPLTDRMRRWYDFWSQNFARDLAWNPASAQEWFDAEGHQIAIELADEISPSAVLRSRFM